LLIGSLLATVAEVDRRDLLRHRAFHAVNRHALSGC